MTARSKRGRPTLSEIEGFAEYRAGRGSEITGVVLDESDPLRLSVRLKQNLCPALTQVFAFPPLPTHVFGRYLGFSSGDAIDAAPENDAPPVGSGPFVLKEWRRGERVTLARNASYWRGAPYLDRYEFGIVEPDAPGYSTAMPGLIRAGRFGFFGIPPEESAPFEEAIHANGRLRIHTMATSGYTHVGWNTRSRSAPGLQDRRVRQALAYGFDASEALRVVKGLAARNVAHHPPSHWGYPAGLEPYEHDPARARRLIESAGYSLAADGYYVKDGRPLAITIRTADENATRRAILQLAVDQYRAIGVRVTPALGKFQEIVADITTGADDDRLEGRIIAWAFDADADPYNIWHSAGIPDPAKGRTGNNTARFSHPVMDAAIEAARNGADCSVAARRKHYETVNRILNEEQPYYFGFRTGLSRAVPTNLRGYAPSMFGFGLSGDHHNVHLWWLAPETK